MSAGTPVELAVVPVRLAAMPVKLAVTPVKLAVMPVKLGVMPVKLAAMPVKLAAAPRMLWSAQEPHAPFIRLSLGCARSVFLPAGLGKRGVSVGVKGGGVGGRTWVRAAGPGGLALVAAAVAILAGCCARAPELPPPHRLPAPADLTLPVPEPVEASPDTLTHIEMRNVLFHLDDDARLHVLRLNGSMHDVTGRHLVVLDDRKRIRIEVRSARITLSPGDLTLILNRYIFGYPGAPIRGLSVRITGDHFEQSGILHKGIDIPFTMVATLSVTPDGLIRLHPTSMKICSLEGLKLVHALGLNLQKMIDLKGATGVHAEGDDLLLDPLASLPPPRITGHLTGIAVRGGEVVQDFGEPDTLAEHALAPPIVAPNYILMKGGSIRFGKLFMVQAVLETIDADPSDPFDFYLDYYASQLVNGYHVTRPDGSLVAWMPDFDDLGTPRGRVALPLESAPARAPDPRH